VLDYFVWHLSGRHHGSYSASGYGIRGEDGLTASDYAAIDPHEMSDYFESFHLPANGFAKQAEAKRKGFYFELIKLRRKILYAFATNDFITNTRSQSRFEQSAIRLCREKNIPFEGLYLPVIADARSGKQFGSEFLIPQNIKQVISVSNVSFLDSGSYWSDRTHLSGKGADAFTRRLEKHLTY
jgi:hypothetical protein